MRLLNRHYHRAYSSVASYMIRQKAPAPPTPQGLFIFTGIPFKRVLPLKQKKEKTGVFHPKPILTARARDADRECDEAAEQGKGAALRSRPV